MTNPPVNEQAERVVLASTFLKNDIVGDCIAAGITEDCFTTQLHKDVWNAVCDQFLNGQQFDELTTTMQLKNLYLPEDVDLYQDISTLTEAVQTTISTPIYINECIDTRNLRKAHHVALSTLDALERGTSYQEIHKNITDTLSETDTGISLDVSIPEVTQKIIRDTRERNTKRIKFIGLSTGFGLVDHILGGLRPESNNILAGRPGGGKCLGQGTPVVMYDGRIIAVEDVRNGDLLMGPDSKPRTVTGITKGYGKLYRVHQNRGEDYIVNEHHILSLKRSKSEKKQMRGKIKNIPIKDFINSSPRFKTTYRGWRSGWHLPEQELSVDPYFLGLWLGDGTTECSNITNSDPEILEFCKCYADKLNHKYRAIPQNNTFRITITRKSIKGSSLVDSLQRRLNLLGVIGNKHIPEQYMRGSWDQRMQLLAGLLDTDGSVNKHGYEITQKSKKLSHQIVQLCRSLGLRANAKPTEKGIKSLGFKGMYYRCHIHGDTSKIPLKVVRKKIKPFTPKYDYTGIKVSEVGYGDYFGFELDGDHLFLLGDGTVTHNTTAALQIALFNLSQGIPVRIHSLEMSPEQLITKMVANKSGVDMNRARDGMLTEEDFQKMEQARAWLTNKPLFIAHTHTTTVEKIAAQHRRDIAKHGNTLCIIDYLQLIKSLNRHASREQQVAEMSRDLKCLFKDTQTQGITLSQMNRNTDETSEPKLSDLRESGSLEQDADTVMFIYKHTDPTKRILKIAKNRHGQEGKAELTFNGATSTLS